MTAMNSVIRVMFSSGSIATRKPHSGSPLAKHGWDFISRSLSLLLMMVGVLSCVGCSNEEEPEANLDPAEQQQTIREFDADVQSDDSDADSETVSKEDPTPSTDSQPGIEISAEELAAALENDAEQAKEKYDKKTIVLSGTVAATDGMGKTVRYADVGILLRGSDQNPVGIHFTTFQDSQFDSLKPGDEVKLTGKAAISPDASDDELKLGLEYSSRLDLPGK